MAAEPITHEQATEPCGQCGAPLARDQRYCLHCGTRRAYLSSLLAEGLRTSQPPPQPPSGGAAGVALLHTAPSRSAATTVIAGVGVLLLAMGVGVLIGRSSSAPPTQAPAQVISVASGAGSTSTGATESAAAATFTSDWPAGKEGYAVQLQTLPEAGTEPSAIQSAKSDASGKGASGVGALESSEFSSLTAGDYVIYSGDYKTKDEAERALESLRTSFPGATVIRLSNRSESTPSAGSSNSTSSGQGNDPSKPAPATVLRNLRSSGGGTYEQKSKSLPNVVETG